MVDQNQEPVNTKITEEELKHIPDSTNLISMLRLNGFNPTATSGGCGHPFYHVPCTPFGCCGSNSMKRRSPSSSSSLQDPSSGSAHATDSHFEPRSKKLFRDQQDLNLNGFSTISFPISLGTFGATATATHNTKPCPVLRRCISDPNQPPEDIAGGLPATPFRSPEQVNAVGNPTPLPLPPSLKRCVSDPTSSPAKTFSRSSSSGDKGIGLNKEEAYNSMRLRRMKDCLREMRKWWDEIMRDEEEEEDDDDSEGAEGDKVLSKDNRRGDAEEAVSVEWAEKCLSICFRCPCTKGYQILLSGNNCYYKLV